MSAVEANALEADDQAAETLEVITFTVDGRAFAVPVSEVREIRGWQLATLLPDSAPHVVGVLNLRGTVIAVYDLRAIFGIGVTEPTQSTVTIVVKAGNRLVGLLADAVSDIVQVPVCDQREPPERRSGHGPRLVTKLLVREEDVSSLLDLAAIVA